MNTQNTLLLEVLGQSKVPTIIYTSAALHIGFMNEGAKSIWAHDQELNEAPFPDLLTAENQQYLVSLISDVWNQARPFRLTGFPVGIVNNEVTNLRYFDMDFQPIIHSSGVMEAMIHTLKEVENPLLELKSGTPQNGNERVAEEKLKQWSKNLSHDLRNPLSVAKLGMQYMSSRHPMTTDDHHKWVNMVIDALKSVETLITDVVELSKDQVSSGTPPPNRVSDLVYYIFTQNRYNLGLSSRNVNLTNADEIHGDIGILYLIFSVAIQSAAQRSTDATQQSQVSISCKRLDDQVAYTIHCDAGASERIFIGFTALTQFMQALKGEVLFDANKKLLQINFPTL